jgi:hypothetical protein
MRDKLFGNARIETMPFEIQIEMARSNLNISPREWENYDLETQGKTLAIEIIKGHIKTLDRFEDILKANKKSGS